MRRTPLGTGTSRRTAVVLVHGAMDRAASFGRVMRRLPHLDVMAYDRRGYGRSASSGVARTLRQHAVDLATVVEWSGASSVVVVGHSLGGTITLLLASLADGPVSAVGAFEPPAPDLDGSRARVGGGAIEAGRSDGPEAAAELFYRHMVGDATWMRLRDADRLARRSEGPALLAELVDLRDGADRPDLDAVEVPVTLGVGGTSDERLRGGALAMRNQFPAWGLHEIAGAGHGAHLTHPDEFARYVDLVADAAGSHPGRAAR